MGSNALAASDKAGHLGVIRGLSVVFLFTCDVSIECRVSCWALATLAGVLSVDISAVLTVVVVLCVLIMDAFPGPEAVVYE